MSELITKRVYEHFRRDFYMNYPSLINQDDFSIKPGWMNLLDETIRKVLSIIDKKDIKATRITHVSSTHYLPDVEVTYFGLNVVFKFPKSVSESQVAWAREILEEAKLKSMRLCSKCGGELLDGINWGACVNHKIFPGDFLDDLEAFEERTAETAALIQQKLNKGDVSLSEAIRLENKLLKLGHFPEYIDETEVIATLKIIDHENIQKIRNDLSDGAQDSDSRSRINTICKALLKRDEVLPYCQLPENLNVFDDLLAKFPNFEAVINVYKRSAYLAKLGDGSLRVPPLLLLGEPGIGKTQFTKELAKLLGTDFLELHMESEQNGASLSGSSEFWANTKPGEIFNLLTKGKYANPMVLADEIDKTMSIGYNPLAGLYRLLEVETAKTFEDESVGGLVLNASGINWILTANDINQIAEPLLSRVTVFEIKKPTFEQLVMIAKNIYSDFRNEMSWGSHFSEELNDDAAEKLACHEPRKIKSLMEMCFANAGMDKSKSIQAKHIPGAEKTKGSMRFV